MNKTKALNESQVKEILSIKINEITREKFIELFANVEGKVKYNTFDTFTLQKGKLPNVKKDIRTTVGKYLFNFFILENLFEFIDYINAPMNKKAIGNLEQLVADLLLEKKITVDIYKDFLTKMNWLGFSTVAFLAPSLNKDFYNIPPKTKKLKEDLLKKYSKEIDEVNIEVIDSISNQLVKSAKEELKGTTLMDFYDSGCRGGFDNYKVAVLLRGLVSDLSNPGNFKVSTRSLIEGNTIDEVDIAANGVIEGAGARALETAAGGYMSKQLTSAFQGVMLSEEGSDCKTKRYLKITLNDNNISKFKYRYIVEGNKLVLLNSDNMKDYIGKTVNVRTPLYCKSELMCEKCFGKLPYLIGIKNVGLTFNQVGEHLKLLDMKAFHNATINVKKFNIFNAIEEV
jgi:hypothetical protein